MASKSGNSRRSLPWLRLLFALHWCLLLWLAFYAICHSRIWARDWSARVLIDGKESAARVYRGPELGFLVVIDDEVRGGSYIVRSRELHAPSRGVFAANPFFVFSKERVLPGVEVKKGTEKIDRDPEFKYDYGSVEFRGLDDKVIRIEY